MHNLHSTNFTRHKGHCNGSIIQLSYQNRRAGDRTGEAEQKSSTASFLLPMTITSTESSWEKAPPVSLSMLKVSPLVLWSSRAVMEVELEMDSNFGRWGLRIGWKEGNGKSGVRERGWEGAAAVLLVLGNNKSFMPTDFVVVVLRRKQRVVLPPPWIVLSLLRSVPVVHHSSSCFLHVFFVSTDPTRLDLTEPNEFKHLNRINYFVIIII